MRLTTHYLFIFLSLAITSILYTLVFLSLRGEAASRSTERVADLSNASRRNGSKSSVEIRASDLPASSQPPATGFRGLSPAFLIYPIIYVVCTSPLAIGRIVTMSGSELPFGYFCAAGALITSNGWLDVLIWGSTRRSVVFGAIDQQEVGVETFSFMRTPANRRYGNMVWVEGAGKNTSASTSPSGSGFWGWIAGGQGGENRKRRERTSSRTSLRSAAGAGGGIQMDLVTTVVVEVEDQAADFRARSRSRDMNLSVNSASSVGLDKDDSPRAY